MTKQRIWELEKRLKQAEDALLDTGLKDTQGKSICAGNVVHWSDGGDDLPIHERIAKRWDRIAVVSKSPDIQFSVIDSPYEATRRNKHTCHYGSFIYKNTSQYLTIVAESVEEYHKLYSNAGECMRWVLSKTNPPKNNPATV